MGRNGKADLPDVGNISGDKGKRFSQPDGSIVHGGNKRNRTEMGEIIRTVANTLGWVTLGIGFLANLDNILSVLLGVVALTFGVYKALHEKEVWLMKRLDRKEREKQINRN